MSKSISTLGNYDGKFIDPEEDNQFSLCVLCGRSFTTISSLHTHIDLVHTDAIRIADSNNFQQTSTPGTSDKPDTFIQSLKEYRKGRKYCCVLCKSQFTGAINLRVHIDTIHLGQRSARCELCQKRFSTMSYLKLHISTVHEGLKAYCCSICSKRYTQKHSLKKHLATTHTDVTISKTNQPISPSELPANSCTSMPSKYRLGDEDDSSELHAIKSIASDSPQANIINAPKAFDMDTHGGRSHQTPILNSLPSPEGDNFSVLNRLDK